MASRLGDRSKSSHESIGLAGDEFGVAVLEHDSLAAVGSRASWCLEGRASGDKVPARLADEFGLGIGAANVLSLKQRADLWICNWLAKSYL